MSSFAMLRRFLVITFRRSILMLLLICLGCVAQSTPPDLVRKIERQGYNVWHSRPALSKWDKLRLVGGVYFGNLKAAIW